MSDQPSPRGPAHAQRANRLASETSPYLLQHAYNPVDWRPWGQEAFEEARRRDVPIFLSVGYSTCYWCHVMERESFEHQPTAQQMNEAFVCIKVDREERPDVDDLYMAATQAFTGRGGWPMSVFLEPRALRPFWAGTYFPVEPRHAMPSFRQVLAGVKRAWHDQREHALAQADALADSVAEHLAAKAEPVALGADQVAQAVTTLLRIHDRAHGGFGQGGPKFPQPSYIDLLLAFRQVARDEETQRAVDAAVRTTLDKMACGGMHDQVGGGFHRYSVDEKWLVPHFEKMLYDNGQLAETYAAAASMYNDAFYARTAKRTVEYVLREMTSPGEGGGAFYSAQDAEVNHREGQNYLWTREQLTEVLGPDDGSFAAKVYGVDQGENFRDPHHPHDPPSNVLFLAARPEIVAAQHNLAVEPFLARLDAINARLYAARAQRDQPHRDEKVLSGWNGMMIAGMAVASVVLDEQSYAAAAQRAADFVLSRMREADAGLLRAFGGAGEAARAHIPAFLDDYAFMVHGLVQLHRARSARGHDDATYLAAARELAAEAQQKFGDAAGGAYFDTRADQPDLFIRGRSTYDGAVPSGVSVMLNDLIDLYEQTGDETDLDRAAAGLSAISAAIAESPVATVNSTRALLRMLVMPPGEARIKAIAETAAPATATTPAPSEDAQPLEVYASTDRIAVKPDEPAGFILEVVLAEGAHVLAADPGPSAAGLTGLRLDVINGSGVAVYADWPEGDPYGPDGELRAYTGRLSVPVILERQGDWSGRPILALRCQVCTETECLPPGAVELAVAIDRG